MQTVGTRMFSVNKEDKSFTADISDFHGGLFDLCQRIYPDASDDGFQTESSRSGQLATFYFEEEFYHGPIHERELAGWKFKPTTETIKKLPHLDGWEVVIFND